MEAWRTYNFYRFQTAKFTFQATRNFVFIIYIYYCTVYYSYLNLLCIWVCMNKTSRHESRILSKIKEI